MIPKRSTTFIIAALAVVLMSLVTITHPRATRAETFDNPRPGAVKWKVVDYNRITTHPARIPFKITVGNDGGIGFDFLFTPDTALLGTSHPSYKGDLLGDMTGKSLTATVGVTVTPTTVFTYYGEGTPSNPCVFPANVRFYFQTDTSGKFEYTDYRWSDFAFATLDELKAADKTITANFSDPSAWSDWNGQSGATNPVAFANAVKDVQFVGLSYGGGCFFENGVGIVPGTGSGYFRLMDFTATP